MKNATLFLALIFAAPAFAAEDPVSLTEIRSIVDSHIGDVKGCMKEHGAATGRLVVAFAIDATGKAVNPHPQSHSSNAKLDECIAKLFGKWTFPKPKGGVLAGEIYPFTFTAPKPAANLTDEQIGQAVQPHAVEVKACYDAALKQKSDLKGGQVHMQIVVAPTGQVAEAKIKDSSTGAPALDQCLVTKVKAWVFPKPTGEGNFTFTYPFAFAAPPAKKPPQKQEDNEGAEE